MRKILWMSLGLCVVSTAAAQAATCLSYEGRVNVAGTLARVVFPGRPNYESIAHGDEPEPVFVLRLRDTACVNPDPGNAGRPAVTHVTNMQLILLPQQYRRFRPSLGHVVQLSGVLVPQETGHHHTPMLLQNVEIIR